MISGNQKSEHSTQTTGTEIDLKDEEMHHVPPRYCRILTGLFVSVYLTVSIIFSVYFLVGVNSNLQNDYLWSHFSYATESYVIKAFKQAIDLEVEGEFDLSDPLFIKENSTFDITGGQDKNPAYSSLLYPHNIYYDYDFPMQKIIASIRRLKGSQFTELPTSYCWVDFNRRWKLAHSGPRQKRCEMRQAKNGAVYLEAILRNTNLLSISEDVYNALNMSVLLFVRNSTEGDTWFRSIHFVSSTIEEEELYWRSKGIDKFLMGWQNYAFIQAKESINIQNVFGINYPIVVNELQGQEKVGSLNSRQFYWGFKNDLKAIAEKSSSIFGKSFIRNSSNYAFSSISPQELYQQNGQLNQHLSFQNLLWINEVGKYGTTDAYLIHPSQSLKLFHKLNKAVLMHILRSSQALQNDMSKLKISADFTLSPVSWKSRNTLYFGGSPICYNYRGVSYIQSQFYYEETCSSSFPFVVRPNAEAIIGSLISLDVHNLKTADLNDICKMVKEVQVCRSVVVKVIEIIRKHYSNSNIMFLHNESLIASNDTKKQNIEIMQYAKVNQTSKFLRASLFSINDNPWNFWSMIMVLRWVEKKSEVVLFEGDKSTITLLSHTYKENHVLNGQIPNEFSMYLKLGAQYVTIVLILVAILVIFYIIFNGGTVSLRNITSFSRIAGVVWIGRPLLFLRSVVALGILCTGNLELSVFGRFVVLKNSPKSIFQTLLIGSETNWINYVCIDMISIFTEGYTGMYCSLSSIMIWIITVIIEFLSPIIIRARVNQSCDLDYSGSSPLFTKLTCSSGTIFVGDSKRFVFLIMLNIICMAVSFFILKLVKPPRIIMKGSELILPGIAREVFRSNSWVYRNRWHLDKPSCVLCGLIPINCCGISRLLDIKSWSLFYLKGTHVSSTPVKENPIIYPDSSKLHNTIKLSVLKNDYRIPK